MQSSRLPTELCEAIMDAVRPRCDAWFDYPEQSRTLYACALTCRAWRPRAQLNLWKAVYIAHVERIVSMFFAAIRSDPARLAPHVRTMCVHPFGEKVPLELFLGPTLPNLRLLTMEQVTWVPFPPRVSRMRLPLLASVTELRLSSCSFHTVKDVLDVVWASPSLVRLVVLKCAFTRTHFTEAEAARLSVMRKRPGACATLRELKLYGHPFDHLSAPLGSVFGSAVTHFDIIYYDLEASVSLPRILNSYDSLQTLIVTGFIWDTEAWKGGGSLIPSLAAALPNPAILRTLILHIEMSYASDEDTLDALTRWEAADTAETPSLRAILSSLTRLEVRIAGVPVDSQKWWFARISERLPSLSNVLVVAVAQIKEAGLW